MSVLGVFQFYEKRASDALYTFLSSLTEYYHVIFSSHLGTLLISVFILGCVSNGVQMVAPLFFSRWIFVMHQLCAGWNFLKRVQIFHSKFFKNTFVFLKAVVKIMLETT